MGMKGPECKEAADADWRQCKYARSFRTARIRAPPLPQSRKMLPAAIAADVKLRHLAAIIDAAVEPEVGIGGVIGLVAITLVRIGPVRIAGGCLAVLTVLDILLVRAIAAHAGVDQAQNLKAVALALDAG